MLTKGPVKQGRREITFELSAEVDGSSVQLCGDFNDWSQTAMPMQRKPDGHFAIKVVVDAGRRYRYRYLVDGLRWENDWTADDYVPNEFGGEDSALDA